MVDWLNENGGKVAFFSADEWAHTLGMKITPQRLTSMYREGLVVRKRDKAIYGDNNYRYDICDEETQYLKNI